MSSSECSVCLNELNKFKFLACGHDFCLKCCEDIVKSTNSPAASVYPKIEAPSISDPSPIDPNLIIECPKCRSITNVTHGGTESLTSRFIGTLSCYQCDTDKCSTEFRWCHVCLRSVCSKCYVDKHINPNGSGLHEATKWEELIGVKTAVAQLKQMSIDNKAKTESCKNYVATYLDGLKEYLMLKVDEVSNGNQTAFNSEADSVAKAYGLSTNAIQPNKLLPEHLFDYVWRDTKNLAKIDAKRDLSEVHFQQFPYQQLEKIFFSKTTSPPKPFWIDSEKLQNRLINTTVICPKLLASPCDLALITVDSMGVLDSQLGIFMGSNGNFTKLKLLHPYQKYGRLTRVPKTDMLIATVHYGVWGFLLLQADKTEHRQFKAKNGQFHWPLPANANLSIAASDANLYAVTHKTLYQFESLDRMNFWEIFAVAGDSVANYTAIGDVINHGDITEFFLINSVWKSVDILSLDSFNNVVSLKRVSLALLCKEFECFTDPMISRYLIDDFYLIWDRKFTTLHLWSAKSNSCTQVADFHSKLPQVIKITEKGMSMITVDSKSSSSRCLEFVSL